MNRPKWILILFLLSLIIVSDSCGNKESQAIEVESNQKAEESIAVEESVGTSVDTMAGAPSDMPNPREDIGYGESPAYPQEMEPDELMQNVASIYNGTHRKIKISWGLTPTTMHVKEIQEDDTWQGPEIATGNYLYVTTSTNGIKRNFRLKGGAVYGISWKVAGSYWNIEKIRLN